MTIEIVSSSPICNDIFTYVHVRTYWVETKLSNYATIWNFQIDPGSHMFLASIPGCSQDSGCRCFTTSPFLVLIRRHTVRLGNWPIAVKITGKFIDYLIGRTILHNLPYLIRRFIINLVWKCSNGTFTDQSREMGSDSHTMFGHHQGLKLPE